MLFLFASVILFGLSLCGAGCLFGKLFGCTSLRNPWIYFWLGVFLISSLSMLGSLFVPVNGISLIIFFIIGAAGLPFFYLECKKSTALCNSIEIKIFGFSVLLVLVVIACLGAFTVWTGAYDTDLYHAQTVRWYNEYGTVPGLGNLHTRLAFNSSWLSLAAVFDNGIWDNRSAWIMPSLTLLGVLLYFLHEIIFSRKNGIRLFALCILAWLLIRKGAGVPSLYYDDSVHMLNAVMVLEAYCLLSGYTRNLSKKEIINAANLLMLGVCAFMIKPIGAVPLLFSGLLTLFLLVRNSKQTNSNVRRDSGEVYRMSPQSGDTVSSWFIIYTPALCAFAVWVIKNIFLSGYLVFPLPVLALPLDWTMPFEQAEGNYKAVLAWARMPGPGAGQSLENGFLFWFKPWLIRNLSSAGFIKLAVFPSCLSVLVWFFVIKYANIKKASFFLIWVLVSIIYWFITAPDPRFGEGFFWVFLGAAFLFAAPDSPQHVISDLWKNQKIRISFFYLWVLCIIFMISLAAFSPKRNLLTIGTIPSRPVIEYTVNAASPFTVWIPYDTNEDRTGNSPLPSTPYAPSNLEMRKPGNLGKGFRPIRR